MNPFTGNVEEDFRMKKVKVFEDDGTIYTGYLQRMEWNQRHVVLQGAERNGEHVGTAYVSHVDEMVLANENVRIKEVNPAIVESHPYSVRSFEPEENAEYLHDVHEHGSVKSFPTILARGGKYIAIDGHKRIWAAETADLFHQPCRIISGISDWHAFTKFAWNHYPLPQHIEEKDDCIREERYSDHDFLESVKKAERDFGDQILDVFPVRYNVERLQGDLL